MWYQKLAEIKSLGSVADRPGSLAGLTETRKQTLSQFFTPQKVVAMIWQIVNAINPKQDQMISIFDNSIGVGSMVWPADPAKHKIYGFDVHKESIDALSDCLSEAGFYFDVHACSMEEMDVTGGRFDFSLINPPFSIPLSSPNLEAYPSCTWGKYGAHTSAISHRYALDQAILNSKCTIAVLPMSHVEKLETDDNYTHLRPCAIYQLPIDAFADQNVHWPMAVCVFSSGSDEKIREQLDSTFTIKNVPYVASYHFTSYDKPRLRHKRFDFQKATITLPVTGDNRVMIDKNGRKVLLRYFCGLTQAKVANAILRGQAKSEKGSRLPKNIRFSGQGVVDLEIHLMQDDPVASFKTNLLDKIVAAGGVPCPDDGIINYLKKRTRKDARARMPMGQVVLARSSAGSSTLAKIAQDFLLDEDALISPVMEKGQTIQLRDNGGRFFIDHDGEAFLVDERKLGNELILQNNELSWQIKSPSKEESFAEIGRMWRTRLKQLKINDWFDREYQINDLIEHMITPTGSICGWTMGAGKTRFALACALLHGSKHTLIIVEPKLIHEFFNQINNDLVGYINPEDVQQIDSEGTLNKLKKINLITLTKLRALVNEKRSKKNTYARALRRRCGLVICDEAHFLSNFQTKQSRAIRALSAKKLIAMSGTIMPNYPRNIHPILNFVVGDGTAVQPWGYYNGCLEKNFIHSVNFAQTGARAFKDEFVTVEWCTFEWEDGLVKGAKREIPRIANLSGYRKMIAPFLKRRVLDEPDVAKYIKIPKPTIKEVFLDWDIDHLHYYLKVAEEFAQKWKAAHEDARPIASLLPRINAVIKASNAPQFGVKGFGSLSGNMPKDDYSIDLLTKWSNQGHKSLFFAKSPKVVKRLAKQLESKGIKCIVLIGEVNHAVRSQMLNDDFKNGDAMVCLASKGSLNTGENVHQASKVLFYERDWSSKTEKQCWSRTQRPMQIHSVEIVFLHYDGGIDVYQKQMLDNKQDAANAGLDYADPEFFETEFLHMDKILYQFVEQLPELALKYLGKAA